MTSFLIILSSLLWLVAILTLRGRQIMAPALSYIALVVLSMAKTKAGYTLVPVNNTILTAWFCMTLVVTLIVLLQPEPVRRQVRGTTYMTVGAITGLAVGLLGFSFTKNLSILYAIMILGVAAGIFCGFLLYTKTPEGKPVGVGSGNFFRYLLAKGFPTAITLMQLGVALVIIIAINNLW